MTMQSKSITGGRVQFTVRLPPDLYAWVAKHAEKEHRTMTGVVELAVRHYKETKKDDNK